MLLALLSILQITLAIVPNYDDDITQPIPIVILRHSPLNEPALKSLGQFNNCTCRESPNYYVVCFGPCEQFPSHLFNTAPLFKLKLSQISTIKRDDFLLLYNINYLEIESNQKLVKLEPGAFRNMSQLQNLSIAFNENLKYLEENVFEGLTNLSTLCIQNNAFTKVIDITRALSIKYVPKLYLLDISQNVIKYIGQHEFYPMNNSQLVQLNMVLCKIEYIHPDALEPLKYLQSFRPGQNLYNASNIADLINRCVDFGIPLVNLNLYEMGFRTKLPMDLLKAVGRSNITYLHLTRNNFQQIDDNSFPYMPSVTKLSLRDNLIMNVTANAFKKLVHLESFYLGLNRFSDIPEGVVLTTLLELDISGNTNELTPSYFHIKNGIFQNMSRLQNLLLAYNNIGYLTKSTFEGLSNLNRLNLKNASLYSIETGAFKPLKNLMLLNLINNFFTLLMPLSADVFVGLENLQVLLLRGCSIKNLTVVPSLFTHTPNLIHLDLARNGLLIISPHQLIHLDKLYSLYLGQNNLPPWNKNILPHMKLKEFSAIQNKFTHVTIKMLEDWQQLETLDLDDNPFTCDCTLYPIVKWLSYNKMLIKCYDSDNFIAQCVSPEKWRHVSIVKFLNSISHENNECETKFVLNEFLLISCISTVTLLILCSILCYIYRWHLEYWLFILRISLKKHNIWRLRNLNLLRKGEYQYDAFVSYCHEDHDFVMKMVDLMENQEPLIRLCVYERDFQIGSLISTSVVESVSVSKRTLLVISDAFAKSQWCRWETQLAEYHQIFFQNDSSNGPDDTLLMIRLENVSKTYLTPVLKYLLKTRIYLQWDSEDPVKQFIFWEKLRMTLSSPKDAINK